MSLVLPAVLDVAAVPVEKKPITILFTDRCLLTVMVKGGEPPIACRRRVWAADTVSGVCYACHPSGRELFVEAIVRRVLAFRDGSFYGKDRRK